MDLLKSLLNDDPSNSGSREPQHYPQTATGSTAGNDRPAEGVETAVALDADAQDSDLTSTDAMASRDSGTEDSECINLDSTRTNKGRHTKHKPQKAESRRTKSKGKSKSSRQVQSSVYASDILDQKYNELTALLEDEYNQQRNQLNKDVAKQMKKMMVSTISTQTPGQLNQVSMVPGVIHSGKKDSPVVIDARDSDRHVTFLGMGQLGDSTEHLAEETSALGLPPGKLRKSRSTRKRAQSATKRRSETDSDDRKRPFSAGSVSPQRERSPSSSSSSSRSPSTDRGSRSPSSSRSRSSSRDNRQINISDHQLKNTSDEKILRWLKEKNKLLRKQHKAEKRKLKEEKRDQEKVIKEKLERRAESQEKVKEWVKSKRKEERLLKKREKQQEKVNALVVHKEIPNEKEVTTTNKTIDLRTGHIIDGASDPLRLNEPIITHECLDIRQKSLSPVPTKKRPYSANPIKTNTKREVPCECGFREKHNTNDSPGDNEADETKIQCQKYNLAQNAKQKPRVPRHPHPPSVKKSNTTPVRSKVLQQKTPKKEEGDASVESTNRLSYDQWLKRKHKEDLRKKKERKKQAQLASSDPTVNEMVKDFARRRIEAIKQGKTRISTGIEEVDVIANTYPRTDNKDATIKQYIDGNESSQASVEQSSQDQQTTARFKEAGHSSSFHLQTRPSSAMFYNRAYDKRKRMNRRPVSAQAKLFKSDDTTGSDTRHSPWSPQIPRVRAKSPKPHVKTTDAYKHVRYQRKSWDNFSEYVWSKLNEDDPDGMDPKAKPAEKKKTQRPEPQGADNPDPAVQQPSHTVDGRDIQDYNSKNEPATVIEHIGVPLLRDWPADEKDTLDTETQTPSNGEELENKQSELSENLERSGGDASGDSSSPEANDAEDNPQESKDGKEKGEDVYIDDTFIAELEARVNALKGKPKDTDSMRSEESTMPMERVDMNIDENAPTTEKTAEQIDSPKTNAVKAKDGRHVHWAENVEVISIEQTENEWLDGEDNRQDDMFLIANSIFGTDSIGDWFGIDSPADQSDQTPEEEKEIKKEEPDEKKNAYEMSSESPNTGENSKSVFLTENSPDEIQPLSGVQTDTDEAESHSSHNSYLDNNTNESAPQCENQETSDNLTEETISPTLPHGDDKVVTESNVSNEDTDGKQNECVNAQDSFGNSQDQTSVGSGTHSMNNDNVDTTNPEEIEEEIEEQLEIGDNESDTDS